MILVMWIFVARVEVVMNAKNKERVFAVSTCGTVTVFDRSQKADSVSPEEGLDSGHAPKEESVTLASDMRV